MGVVVVVRGSDATTCGVEWNFVLVEVGCVEVAVIPVMARWQWYSLSCRSLLWW